MGHTPSPTFHYVLLLRRGYFTCLSVMLQCIRWARINIRLLGYKTFSLNKLNRAIGWIATEFKAVKRSGSTYHLGSYLISEIFKKKRGKTERGETFWDHQKGMFLRKAGRLVVRRGTNRIEPTSPLIINKHLEYSFNLKFRLTNRPAELYNVRKKPRGSSFANGKFIPEGNIL